MGSTYSSLNYHIIFSTKRREPLVSAGLRAELYPYIGGFSVATDASSSR